LFSVLHYNDNEHWNKEKFSGKNAKTLQFENVIYYQLLYDMKW